MWLKAYQVCSNDDLMLTFVRKAQFDSSIHLYGKNFLRTVEGLCIIFGTLTLLAKNMKILQCRGHWMIFDLCFKVPWIHFFKQLLLWSSRANCDYISYLTSLVLGEQKLIQMVTVCWPRWPPCPYMVKTLGKSSPEPRKRKPWNFV